MLFWERFYDLCLKNNLKPNAVCKTLELSNAAATHWKKGAIPNADAVLKISYYFDCSTDYLLGRSDSPRKSMEIINKSEQCDSDEQQKRLMDNYDKMNSIGQQALVSYSGYLVEQPENLKADREDNKIVS